MSDITINYKGSSIATMDASGTKTLLTEGKYCEDDLEVVYVKPSGGTDNLAARINGTLTSYSSTEVTTVCANAFREYPGTLTSVSFPNCTSLEANCFYNCQSLGPVTLPSFENCATGGYQFERCYALTGIDVGNANTNINRFASIATFERCTNLSIIIIRSPNVAPLSNTNAFANGAFPSGTLYVPSALIDSYKAASNWSSVITNNNITVSAIEGSQYETVHLDGTQV